MAEPTGGGALQREVVINTTINNSELATGVAEANQQINKLGSGGGTDAGTKAVKGFKQQLKEAKEAALALQQAGKQNSKEYLDQLRIIQSLKDEMETLGRAAQAFDPGNKLQALNKVASLAASSFGALTGTFTLLGISADTANESIAKLQSIQAIIGLIDNFGDAMDVLNPFLDNLLAANAAVTEQVVVVEASTVAQAENVAVTGAQVVATEAQAVATTEVAVATEGATVVTKLYNLALQNIPFILIATAIIAVVTGFVKFKKQIFEAIPFLKDLVDVTGKVITAITDFVGITSEAERASEAFSIAVKKANGDLEYQNKLLAARGGNERQQYLNSRKILDNTISDLKVKAKAENEYNQEYYDNLEKAIQDRNILDATEEKRLEGVTKKRADDAKKRADEQAKKNKAILDEGKKNVDEASKVIEKGYLTDRKKEEIGIRDNYKAKLAATKKAYGENSAQVKTLLDAQATELGEVKVKYDQILDKAFEEQNDKAVNTYDLRIKALQEKYNEIRKNNPERADEINTFVSSETKKIRKEETLNKSIINDEAYVADPNLSLADRQAAELQLLSDKYTAEIELKTLSDEEKVAAQAKYNESVYNVNKEYSDKDRELKKQQEEAEANLQAAKASLVTSGLEVLSTIFGKNKALATALFAVEKGVAIGQIVINAQKAIAAATANLAATPAPLYAAQAIVTAKGILSTKISAAAGIASIAATSIGKFMNSSSAPSTGTGDSGGVNYNQAPTINSNANNNINTTVQDVRLVNQAPIKAYLTDKDVKTSRDEEAFYNRIGSV